MRVYAFCNKEHFVKVLQKSKMAKQNPWEALLHAILGSDFGELKTEDELKDIFSANEIKKINETCIELTTTLHGDKMILGGFKKTESAGHNGCFVQYEFPKKSKVF